MELLANTWSTLVLLLTSPFGQGWLDFILKFVPFVIFLELPIYVLILLGIARYALRKDLEIPTERSFYPMVSCLVTCYSEGDDVKRTIVSLAEQNYAGRIEIIVLVDGAVQNNHTFNAARSMESYVRNIANRKLRVIPKWQRGGRVSSLNLGLTLAGGPIIMALDGDTSFDNDMVLNATRHFENPAVVGVAGSLRVRNGFFNLVTRFQALEYLLSIHASKVGLSEFNTVNNISGAFGIFRREFIENAGGWDAGTAEDLDLTLRIKNYFGRHPHLRIVFEPRAMGHTDAPNTWSGFFKQRLRWDGDLFYLYFRKHSHSFTPRMLGWRNLILQLWTGLFFQIIMPFIIVFYSLAVFMLYPPSFVLAVWSLLYIVYALISTIFFIAHIALISERRQDDLRLAWLLPLLPVFTFAQRIWNALATLKEMTCSAHLDSSMAPWWVLRKSKF